VGEAGERLTPTGCFRELEKAFGPFMRRVETQVMLRESASHTSLPNEKTPRSIAEPRRLRIVNRSRVCALPGKQQMPAFNQAVLSDEYSTAT